jgi:hypothetical protein
MIFNRPDVTFRVFERIRQAKPKYLFISADGPRPDRPGEKELCDACRSVVTKIDWDCELKTLFREENIGCGKGVSEAINWLFRHTDKGIILEDDCLPDLSFFTFCTELLHYYENEKSIMHISGNNSQLGKKRNSYSYYYSKYPHIWGWATWKRAWDLFQYDLSKTNVDAVSAGIFQHYHFSAEEKIYWSQAFDTMQRGAIDTWDIQWTFSCWANGGITVVPNVNLISNIGFDTDATHTKSKESKLSNLPTGNIKQIVHPPNIVIDVKADDFTFSKYNLGKPDTFSRISAWAKKMVPDVVKQKIKSKLSR